MRGINALIAIIVLVAIVGLAAVSVISFVQKSISQQQKEIIQKNEFNKFHTIGKIAIRTETPYADKDTIVNIRIDLKPVQDIVSKYGSFALCDDPSCSGNRYYYCWETPNGECVRDLNKNWNKYIIWVRIDRFYSPIVLYMVYGKGKTNVDGKDIFLLYTNGSYLDGFESQGEVTTNNGIIELKNASSLVTNSYAIKEKYNLVARLQFQIKNNNKTTISFNVTDQVYIKGLDVYKGNEKITTLEANTNYLYINKLQGYPKENIYIIKGKQIVLPYGNDKVSFTIKTTDNSDVLIDWIMLYYEPINVNVYVEKE
ncbi:NEQ458 [Nanoarchaeum equitans Kin4-M]|uniref:NEQ458 n=1 Tax=Nanoarchaeum equitans (strain Kin4-M) TaxID=228908 RepID=Q74MY9_NANEQ|nr:NEQ458 [Nanoarchaeum equitans Kin4-M]